MACSELLKRYGIPKFFMFLFWEECAYMLNSKIVSDFN